MSASTSFRSVWRTDLLAGFQVFLIALPLSLGIAIASGVPPMAGIVAAIVGGALVSRISGSHVTINGPAAGLIVVIFAGVERLGRGDMAAGYRLTLAAIVCAGVIQILFGLLRVGRFSVLFPNAAVHGMMAAIGVIVFGKQLPILLGTSAGAQSIFGIFARLNEIFANANPLVAGTGLVGLCLLVVVPGLKGRLAKVVPPPVWVVAVGALIGWLAGFGNLGFYELWGSRHHLGPDLYLSLPGSVFSTLGFPDFSRALSWDFAATVISISLVASLETLLSAAAVDKIDPLKRTADLNKDLLAIGVGTVVSGMLGGLPMIAEIVRSNANVSAGGRTGWANFFHGCGLLLAVVMFPWLLTNIPMTSLAALLVYTGCRLASPKHVKHMAEIGADQAIVFLTTLVMVLATDLLVGIACGVAMKIVLHLFRRVPLRDLLRSRFETSTAASGKVTIRVRSCLVFTNILPLLAAIEALPKTTFVTVDLSDAPFIDHTALDRLHAIKADRGVNLAILESAQHESRSQHVLASRRLRA